MKKKIRWFSVFLAVSMLFMSLNVNVFAEEDTMDNQANDEPLVADYPEGVVENNIPLLSTEPTETENNNRASTAVIEDGVYAIMSYSYTYRWITIENDSPWEDANVQQEYSSSYPTTSFDRSSLFKISRVGTTDRYIIRSMVNNRMTIDLTSDGKVITKKIPAEDSSVNISDTFLFETDGAGYYLRPYGYAYAINLVSTSTANLSTTLKSSAPSSAKWTFVKYTGESKNGMTLYRPASWGSIGNVVGDTSNATLVGWSTHINANKLSMDIRSGYEDLGTLSWNSSTNKMTLVAENPGQIRINGRIKYANGTEVYSGYFSHMIVPQEGTYYIQNAGTEKYIDIEGPSYSSGATVQQWQFHTGNQEKWIIEHVENSGGYIRLKSVYSGHYIGVDSSNTSAIKQYNYQNNYTLWKIDRSSAGNLMLICKGTESTGVVLAVPLNADSNGTDLTQIAYTDNTNYRDEWLMYQIKYTYYVNHYYDQGFGVRFAYIDSDAEELIYSYQKKAAERFLRIYNVQVIPNFTSYSSSADTCKIMTYGGVYVGNCGETCKHTSTHLTTTVLRNDLSNGTTTTSVTIWTGHKMKDNARSNSNSTRYSIVITPWLTSTLSTAGDTERENVFDLTHEQSHQLGAPDHYCYGVGSSGVCSNEHCDECRNGYSKPRECLMSKRYDVSTLTDQNMYCSDCKYDISSHLDSHH